MEEIDKLVCVDGLISYVTACQRVFRKAERTGRRGRPHLVGETGLVLGQVIKRRARRRVVEVERRVVLGTATTIAAVLITTGTGTMIQTADIDRLNATFRAYLAPLARRGRARARTQAVLTGGMYLVGCSYNFGWHHASLRRLARPGSRLKWQARTPAMAAGLSDHRWSLDELLRYQVPRPAWMPPKRPGRPPKSVQTSPAVVAA